MRDKYRNAKFIPLRNRKYAIVDSENFKELNKYKWCCVNGYAQRSFYHGIKNGKIITSGLLMSRIILNAPIGKQVDHINHNTLDNRKCNLRIATHAENQHNRKKSKNKSSRYKGVSYKKSRKKWIAKIKLNKKSYWLGSFLSEKDAAKAYNKASKKYHGKFSFVNKL